MSKNETASASATATMKQGAELPKPAPKPIDASGGARFRASSANARDVVKQLHQLLDDSLAAVEAGLVPEVKLTIEIIP